MATLRAADVEQLQPGQKVRIAQRVRIGRRTWNTNVIGIVRDVQALYTGLTVERGKDDIVSIRTLHFTKENGELSSITVDEYTEIELL